MSTPAIEFQLSPAPDSASLELLQARVVSASTLERLTVFTVEPMVDLGDPRAVDTAIRSALHACGLPRVTVPSTWSEQWVAVSRGEADRLLLHALRFSLAYGAVKGRGDRVASRALTDGVIASAGPDARWFTNVNGLHTQLDAEGAVPKRGFGYSSSVLLTEHTFELAVIAVDWERCVVALFTDED